jgi:hypothetical protein
MPKPRREDETGIFYCATCGDLGPDERGHPIGTSFKCPNDNNHFAAVVKVPAGAFWLRIEKYIWTLQLFSPLQLLGSGDRAGLYHCFRLGALLGIAYFVSPHGSWLACGAAAVLGVYFLYDTLLLSTYATFVSRYPTHPLRSLALNFSSLFQSAVAYAIFYVLFGDAFNRCLSPTDAIYFSVVTISTVGYGDIHVTGNSLRSQLAEALVVSEIVVGLYIMAGLVAVVVGWANRMPNACAAKPLKDLQGPAPDLKG